MLTLAMQQHIDATLLRVKMTKFTSAKQMREYREAIVSGINPLIFAVEQKKREKDAKRAEIKATRDQFKQEVIIDWANKNLNQHDVIRLKGTTTTNSSKEILVVGLAANNAVWCINPRCDKVNELPCLVHDLKNLWKIKINDVWVDVYKLASGAQ